MITGDARTAERTEEMNYTIRYDEEHDALYVKTLAMLTAEDVHEMIPKIKEIFKGKGHRRVIGDISQNPAGLLSKDARNAFRSFADELVFDKIAIIGANPATRMIAKIALQVMGRANVSRFFQSEEEALDWLKGE